MNCNFGGSVDSDAYLISPDINDCNLDVIVDNDGLVFFYGTELAFQIPFSAVHSI